MKKSINLLLMIFMVIAMASCGGRNDRVLKAQIESGKKHCPMNLGMAGKLTSMDYDDKSGEVAFVITVNKQVKTVEEIKKTPEATRQAVKLAMQQGQMKKLLEMMADADASLKVTYKNRGSNDEFDVTFSEAEIKDMLEHPMSEEEINKMLLQTEIDMEKSRIPYKVEKGLTVTNIEDNGNSLVYICEVNEDLYEVESMEEGKEELKNTMRKMMKDRTMRKQAEVLAALGKGFEYHYVGNKTGKKVIVAFSADEIGEIAKKK